MKKGYSGNQGAALPAVIMITTLLMILAGIFIQVAHQERQSSADEVNMTKALYLADAGVELTLQELQDLEWGWSKTEGKVFYLNNDDPKQEVEIKYLPETSGAEKWDFESTGKYKDQEGRLLSAKILSATVQKSLTPQTYIEERSFTAGVDLGNEDLAGTYYHQGDLTLSGIYRGRWLIAVDGNVTIEGDLKPPDPWQEYKKKDPGPGESPEVKHNVFLIISSGTVEVLPGSTGEKEVWTVIYAKNFIERRNSNTLGEITAGTVFREDPKKMKVEEQQVVEAFVQETKNPNDSFDLDYRAVLVRWREKYPVF
ncbi:PilX N-terminal domain-containing pilus assembly protein [Desulforamulus ruminis]|uniref:Type 4 fimbrial biogenesis protein PilX N-terminal domain-containing protein n=1 Tax=Desulforamulus ruminis (strain ATCC 23193 / DSM 2154 / NCIMB 8452 / DL) TaxID=696281 RepID=F6DUD1_DESRL|nr:PilX N-terminal domain-containing pilus assembly protein [Desulforamulus ruminis]AEG61316.1 hypothetical protein Desru_3105 [Desulforamulus ruminis DSM 2154]